MIKKKGPISPHLTIYRRQITSVLSILHRITGIVLFVGFMAIAWLVVLLGVDSIVGAHMFDAIKAIIFNKLTAIGFMVLLYALCFHFCTGMRHLFWWRGLGFELSTVAKSGWTAVMASFIMMLATIYNILTFHGM